MEKKKLKRFFNLNVNSGVSRFEDTGIGPVLSPFMNKEKVTNFCNEFNKLSKNYKNNLPLRVLLCLFFDNTFFFLIKGINASLVLKLILNIEQFSIKNIQKIDLFDFFFIIFLKLNIIHYKHDEINSKNIFFSLFNTINGLINLIKIKNDYAK